MKNITLKIDDETYRKARVRAAKEGTSISAMVRQFLMLQAEADDAKEARRVAELEALYRIAKQRGKKSNKAPLKPLTRDEAHADRVR